MMYDWAKEGQHDTKSVSRQTLKNVGYKKWEYYEGER
jgi:hypothetical protein